MKAKSGYDQEVELEPLLRVKELKKYFQLKRGFYSKAKVYIKAVDGINFDVARGETLGLVGESGCGKTTTGWLILRLLEPTSGIVEIDGVNVFSVGKGQLRKLRKSMHIIFQDPYNSLSPRMKIGDIVSELLDIHGIAKGEKRKSRICELLSIVGLSEDYSSRYPHELSGGQRQRVSIARALASNPDLIVCDEPLSALDVSIQSQILNLLMDLQEEFGLTYLFIAHNLAVVKHISHRIAVMYLGKIVEMADKKALFSDTLHPYTQALLSAILTCNPERISKKILLKGDAASLETDKHGCNFYSRCWIAKDICAEQEPELKEITAGHYAACHLIERGN